MDLSAFDAVNMKVSPDVQAERDRAANELRLQEGSRTIQEDDAAMRKAVKKQGPDPELTNIKPVQMDLSAFDKPKMDLSSFDEMSDLETVGQGFADVGRFAAKGIASVPGIIAAPIAGAGTALAGGTFKEGYDKALDVATGADILQPKTAVGRTMEHVFEKGMEIAREYGALQADEYLNRMGVSKDNPIRAALYGLSQAAPDATMAAVGIKAMGPRGKPAVEAPKAKPTIEVPPPEAVETPIETIPYEKANYPIQGSELGATAPKTPLETIKYDPQVEALQGEAATELSARSAGVDRPLDMQLDLFERIKEIDEKSKPSEISLLSEPERQFKEAQMELFPEENPKGLSTKPGFQQDALERMAARDVDSQARSPNAGKFGQGGAVDWSAFKITSEVQKDSVQKVAEAWGMLKKSWPRFAENMDIKILNKEDYEALSALGVSKSPAYVSPRDKIIYFNIDHPGVEATTSRGVAGVLAHELTHGLQVNRGRFEKQNWNSPEQWEKAWKDRPWEQEAEQARETALQRFKYGRRELNKGTFGQSGGIDFSIFKRSEKKEPKSQIEVFGNRRISTEDWMAENTIPESGLGKDITNRLGVSSASFRSSTPLIFNPNSITHKAIKHFEDKLHDAVQLAHRLNYADQGLRNSYDKYYGLKVNKFLAIDQFREDIAHILKWEKDPSTWFNGVDYYPTGAQMIQMGMKPQSAALWRRMFDSQEKQWVVAETTAIMNGQPVPPRIPGWVSHVFKGPYSVYMELKRSDGTIANVGEYNYYKRKDALKAQQIIDEQIKNSANPAVTTRLENPNPHGSGAQEMLDGLWRAKDRMEQVKGLENLTKMVFESLSKGIVTSVLERAPIPKIGHILERVTETDPTKMLNRREMKDAMKSFQHVSEAVNEWHARSKFVNETLFPMDQGGYLDMPNVKAAAKEYLENYFKIPNTFLKSLDIKMKDVLINHGLDPNLAHAIAGKLNSGFGWYYLLGNLSYYLVNSLQSTISLPALGMVKALGTLRGEKTGSIFKAIANKDYANLALLDPKNPLVKYASENGHIDPVGLEHLQPGQWHDPVNSAIERRTRMNSFNIGYNYARQIMSHEEALAFGGKFADMVSVPYSKQLGTPSIISRMPIAGTAITMFTTYQMHMLGLLRQQLAILGESARGKNPAATSQALGSMVGLQLMNIGFFGLGGLAFVQNWNEIVKLVNTIFKTDYATSQEWGREIDAKVKEHGVDTGNLFARGAVSNQVGFDISSSGSGPALQAPTAAVNAYATLIQGAILTGRWASGSPPTQKEQWEWARNLPKTVQGPMEYMIKNNWVYDDVVKTVMGEKKDFSATKDINMQGIERTRAQTLLRLSFGLKSNAEAAYNQSEAIDITKQAQIKNKVNYLMQRLKETPASKFGPVQRGWVNELAQIAGSDPDEVVDAIINYKQKTKMTPDQRRAQHLESIGGIKKYQQFEEQRSLE